MVGNANLFNTLRPGQPVEAEVWDGQIVLARTADGGTMPTEYEPRHAADQDFLWAVLWGSFSLLVAAATGGIRYHERQRRLRRAARRRLAASQERHPA